MRYLIAGLLALTPSALAGPRDQARRLHDRLVGDLPRYAPLVARLAWLANLRDKVPGMGAYWL